MFRGIREVYEVYWHSYKTYTQFWLTCSDLSQSNYIRILQTHCQTNSSTLSLNHSTCSCIVVNILMYTMFKLNSLRLLTWKTLWLSVVTSWNPIGSEWFVSKVIQYQGKTQGYAMVISYSGSTQSDMSVSVPCQNAFRKYLLTVFNMRIKIISIANGCLSEYKIDVLHELNCIHYFHYSVQILQSVSTWHTHDVFYFYHF